MNKILYLVNTRIPSEKAHGYQISKMCEAFASLGCDVELWAPARKNNIKESVFDYYNLNKNFKVKYINSPDFLSFSKSKLLYRIQTLSFLFKLFFLRIDSNSVVYTRAPEIAFVRGLRGDHVVYEDHEWPNNASLYVFLLRYVKKVVCITKGVADEYIKRGLKKSILISPDGVDLDMFGVAKDKSATRISLNLPVDKKIVLYSGSLSMYAWKGVDTFLNAVELLPHEFIGVVLGGNKDEISKLKMKTSQKIMYVERQKRDVVADYLKAADVLVLPNKKGDPASEKYTSPLKMFEYMASGVPIVASNLPSMKEVLNEKNCFFFEPNNETDLSHNILRAAKGGVNEALTAYNDVQAYKCKKRAAAIIEFIKQ
jgi:glycosyltransferase involved in cell wall biosynthesis